MSAKPQVSSEPLKAHEAIANLGEDFRRKNHGKFIVMSYSGEQVALGDTIQDIRAQLKAKGVRGNAVIERIGFRSLVKFEG
jgi:hypothetical protein